MYAHIYMCIPCVVHTGIVTFQTNKFVCGNKAESCYIVIRLANKCVCSSSLLVAPPNYFVEDACYRFADAVLTQTTSRVHICTACRCRCRC